MSLTDVAGPRLLPSTQAHVTRSDAEICREILVDVLPGVEAVGASQLTVGVYGGVVTLLGDLVDDQAIHLVVQRVCGVPGVVDVVSHLTVGA